MLYQCRPSACSSASDNFYNRQEGKRPSPPTCNWSPIWYALVSQLSKMCETRVLEVGGDPVSALRKQLSSGLRYIWGICFDLPFGVGDHTMRIRHYKSTHITQNVRKKKCKHQKRSTYQKRLKGLCYLSCSDPLNQRLECVGIFHFQRLHYVVLLTDTCFLVSEGFNIICFVKTWTCHFLTQLTQVK